MSFVSEEKDRPSLRDLLAFYAEAGVDDALVEEPVDRFAVGEARSAPLARQPAPPSAAASAQRPPEQRPPAAFANA